MPPPSLQEPVESPPRHWSVGARLIALTAPPLLLFLGIVTWFFPGQARLGLLEEQVTVTAKAVLTQIQADREYYASVIVPRLANLNAHIQADYHQIPTAFPLPATFLREVSDMIARNRGPYQMRLVSPWPINKQNGIQDDFQAEGFRVLQQSTDRMYSRRDTINGVTVMRFLAADRAVAQSCVTCHNSHADSPRHDFRLNDIMGGIEVSIPIDAPLLAAKRDQLVLLGGGLIVGMAIIGLVILGTRRVVTQPLRHLTNLMRDITQSKGEISEAPPVSKWVESDMGEEVRVLWQQFWEMHRTIHGHQEERTLEFQLQAEVQQSLNSRLLELYRVGQTIQQAISEEEVYRTLSHTLRQALSLRQILILRLNASEDRLEIIWTDPKRDDLGTDAYPVWDEPLRCPVIRSGREYVVQDTYQDLTCPSSLSNDEEGAYWCVPLVIGARTIGVVHLVSATTHCWTQETRQWVESLVNVAAPMIGHLQHIERAKRRALTDELTGTYNRRFLDEVLAKMILSDERRRRQSLSLLMVDVDHFKAVNDAYGHPVGDLVLKTVASTIHRALKSSDILVRYGGEEFAVLLPQTDTGGATVVAERLKAVVGSAYLRRLAPAAPDYITVSIGVATYPTHAGSVDELIRKADEALYQAKSLGRNRVICAPTISTAGPPVAPGPLHSEEQRAPQQRVPGRPESPLEPESSLEKEPSS